ncbi:imelysin family protein [Agaribacterium sp. ZY112]|uniref:imelysin family protein n=1 Tax=Agaribacterium sp. ZY112 TaxID=3233574 RepID=UPI0035251BB7
MRIQLVGYALALFASTLLLACEADKQISEKASDPQPQSDINIEQASQSLWASFRENTEDASLHCGFLQHAINQLLTKSQLETLYAAQKAWHNCANKIEDLNLLTQLNLLEPSLFQSIDNSLVYINSKPIQGGYLDRFGPYLYSGLVHDIGINLNSESLRHQHGLTDKEEVVLGIYAIEFMLFGEQGSRPPNDYLEQKTLSETQQHQQFRSIDEVPNNRRRQLLLLQSQLLNQELLLLQEKLQADKSPANVWPKLPARQQINSVHNAVTTSLSQSLIQLSQNYSTNNETIDSYFFENLHAQLYSLNPALNYYSTHERQALKQALEQAQSLAHKASISPQTKTQKQQLLEKIYTLMQVFI